MDVSHIHVNNTNQRGRGSNPAWRNNILVSLTGCYDRAAIILHHCLSQQRPRYPAVGSRQCLSQLAGQTKRAVTGAGHNEH